MCSIYKIPQNAANLIPVEKNVKLYLNKYVTWCGHQSLAHIV